MPVVCETDVIDTMRGVTTEPSVDALQRASEPAGVSSPFEHEAHALLTRLQSALAQLLRVRGKIASRAKDLQEMLGLRAPVAWQLFRWATSNDPYATAMFILRPEAMGKTLEEIADAGVEPRIVKEIEQVYAEFQSFVEQHAKNRRAFDAMVAALRPQSTPGIELKYRRTAFQTNSHIWGISTDTVYTAVVYNAIDPHGTRFGSLMLRGLINLRTTRPFNSLLLQKRYLVSQDERLTSIRTEFEFMIFEDFCSKLNGQLRLVRSEDAKSDTLHLENIPRNSTSTIFVGACALELPAVDLVDNALALSAIMRFPCTEAIFDLVVPEHCSHPAPPDVRITGRLDDPNGAMGQDGSLHCNLSEHEAGQYVGTSLNALRCSEVPMCPELIRAGIRRAGWDEQRYNIYRARIRFPILHSHIRLETLRNQPDNSDMAV